MEIVRVIVGGAVAIVGAAIAILAIAREWLADPLGLDWLDPSNVDQQVLGGDINNYLLFMAAGAVVASGAWIAGKTDEWF